MGLLSKLTGKIPGVSKPTQPAATGLLGKSTAKLPIYKKTGKNGVMTHPDSSAAYNESYYESTE